MADMAEVPDMANSRVILPPMANIDGKSEIMNHPLTDWPTHSLTAPCTPLIQGQTREKAFTVFSTKYGNNSMS